ncbi:LANO_0E00760g1_1 [Lachancea nothofagi CBS 11611]|uniref:LANO_0E00760g1_1 n=1 Tax=Lachancea nothofagi CBS 11611 TaxID=1266666 RepID=A0A1G4JP06_9SACH|nr:LANO_0E00760g1_1 [Lachancea nothofagi CBS 11611]
MTVAENTELEQLSNRLADTAIAAEEAQDAQSAVTPPSKSSTPNSSALQLDQLANTNLLTVRVKWVNNQVMDLQTSELVNKLSELAHAKKGFAFNPSVIENYEYLSDKSRLVVLEENNGIYMHESGTEEFASCQDGVEIDPNASPSTWLYDFVFQSQFKQWLDLVSARDSAVAILQESAVVNKWSISENAHALTHPGNLYIRGIPKDLTIDDLVPIFSKFGPVLALKIICDSNTGESLGYGFLSYPLGSQASRCIKELNGNLMNGSPLFINYHVERKERERIHWDHIKEDNDDDRFKGVFIGNLPLQDMNKTFVTPEDVVTKFESELAEDGEPVEVLSYYLPKRNSESEIEYDDNDEKANDVETCASRHEDCPLKGYGFIKFDSHAQALRAIEKFHDMEWLGNTLVVNKAVQSKAHAHHHHHHYNHHYNQNHHHRAHNEQRHRRHSERSIPSRQSSLTNISFYAPFSGSQSGLGFLPNAMPLYAQAGDLDPHDTTVGYSPVSSPSPNNNYAPPAHMTHMFGAPPSLSSTPESSTAPSSRNGSIFHVQNQNGMLPHSPFMLPIPTKDQQESNLYVKHLPLTWRDQDFNQFYEKFGEIISAKIITVGGSKNGDAPDGWSPKPAESPLGTSRGYGFVCFKNPLDASRAMMITDRYQVDENHTLYVSFAQKRAKSISNGDSIQATFNDSRPVSSRKNSYHNQSFRPDLLGKYNPKFLNAMLHQQNGGKPFVRPRGSWPVALGVPVASPYAVPMVNTMGSTSYQSSPVTPEIGEGDGAIAVSSNEVEQS